MVGAGVAARKLWTSLRASVAANGRGMKSRLAAMNLLKKRRNKKKANRRCRNASSLPPTPRGNRHRDRYDHYNYSDDDEADNRIKRKLLRKWSKLVSLPAVACVLGTAEAEPRNQFVYVTDLYAAPSSRWTIAQANDMKAEKDANAASASSQPEANMVDQDRDEEPLPVVEVGRKSASLSGQSASGGKMEREVDTQADEFIARFYDEIKMQRQKSLGEYREMLERGTT